MDNSKELVFSDSSFIQELLPSAQHVALHYQLSYLGLGNFPKLNQQIKVHALETQHLFGSSEDLLFKCMGTSSNLVSSLFPMLMQAVETSNHNLAVKHLEEANSSIKDIIRAVEKMVKRYDEHNLNLASCISDVIQEKTEAEKQLMQQSEEIKALETAVAGLEEELRKNTSSIEEIEKKIQEKNTELENHIRAASESQLSWGIMILGLAGLFIKAIYDAVNDPGTAETQALTYELSQLTLEKASLKNLESKIHNRLTDQQLKLVSCKKQLGAIPSPVHLGEVQKSLSRIQKILIQLRVFWEKVGTLLELLKEKTFVGKDLIDDPDMKDDFLKSIEMAGKCWTSFGASCERARGVFSVQDGYNFLEINLSTLSEAEWSEQYERTMEKLKKIRPENPSVLETNTAAINP
ncbi:uncharacterized protein LOC127634614 isoform X3 [Xyrauchen texanus]|uniref:uncharacterized protein LOC127634614 isoform X3 n=1 Tax=Xyrauchen texanus TaxID=154827 RepID=UPI0022426AD8|nr:uncharacterized protein LOC127634614 isoform X3 [Xyrauchen texanus]